MIVWWYSGSEWAEIRLGGGSGEYSQGEDLRPVAAYLGGSIMWCDRVFGVFPGGRVRCLRCSDRRAFQAYRGDEELGRYQGWEPMTDQEAFDFLYSMSLVRGFTRGEWVQLGIAAEGSDWLIGDIGLYFSEGGRYGELGYTLRRASQGQGIATAAVGVAIELFFKETESEWIQAVTDERNGASVRLLERLGFCHAETRSVLFRGERCVELEYRLGRGGKVVG